MSLEYCIGVCVWGGVCTYVIYRCWGPLLSQEHDMQERPFIVIQSCHDSRSFDFLSE